MISIIIPFHNEEENLPLLNEKLHDVLKTQKQEFEIIYVDDGSTDKSQSVILASQKGGRNIKLESHKTRLGKGKALETGIAHARGDVLIFMDADLQDDPADIPFFLEKIDEGYDFVNGWREKRNDPIAKTLPSSIFNFLLLKPFLRSKLHDINCGFKAIKKDVLEAIPLYGDNYRFLPLIADREGFKITEVSVKHNPREHGKSKYGFVRIFYGFFDTLTTYFIYQFAEKPLHFFGPIGGVSFLAGFVILVYLTILRLFYNVDLYRRPILLFGVLLVIVGLQIIMTGIIGELIVYINQKKNKIQNNV